MITSPAPSVRQGRTLARFAQPCIMYGVLTPDPSTADATISRVRMTPANPFTIGTDKLTPCRPSFNLPQADRRRSN